MSSEIGRLLQGHVEAGAIPGGLVLVARDGQVRTEARGGVWPGGPAFSLDTIVRIQSMTKAVTAVAALLAVQEEALGLHDPVERWLPELADRRVLRTPGSALDDVVEATRPITVRDLLINGSGYGALFGDDPLGQAMVELGVDAGPDPVALAADEWLQRLAPLPLVHQPGKGFRYHHSFQLLGILLQRWADTPLDDHLHRVVFGPLGMVDTGLSVPEAKADRLAAAYHRREGELVEVEPAGTGFYVGAPSFDTAHGELVSTAADYHRFLQMLADGGRHEGLRFLDPALVTEMTRDQVEPVAKTPDSFFPGFWDDSGWGYGVGVTTAGEHTGRFGWAGGQGTDFFVDPDGTVAILLTQVELNEQMWPVLTDFQRAARTLLE